MVCTVVQGADVMHRFTSTSHTRPVMARETVHPHQPPLEIAICCAGDADMHVMLNGPADLPGNDSDSGTL